MLQRRSTSTLPGRANSSCGSGPSCCTTTARSLMSGSTLLRAPRLSRQPTLPLRAAPPHNKPKLSYVGVRASELASSQP